jgi:dihydrofolate reductase
MKVILYMAMTPNGIIARSNNEEDFLSDENWKVFCGLAKDIGCFVVGRKTYEVVKKWKDFNFDDVHAEKIIVSGSLKSVKNYSVVKTPEDAIKKAATLGFNKMLLTGGGQLNNSFMRSGLVDEIILNLEPVMLGSGIKLFGDQDFHARLRLVNAKQITRDIVQLHYKVVKKKVSK